MVPSAVASAVPAGAPVPPVGADALIDVGATPGVGTYLATMWRRRHFAQALAQSELRSHHMNSVLGQLWHLLNPAMMILIYFLVFGLLLDARRGVDHYVTFLVIGVVMFRFPQNSIIGATRAVVHNVDLIRTIQFPRALIPVSVALENFLAWLPGIAIMVAVAVVDGAGVSWRLVALPAVVLATMAFTTGWTFVAARAGAAIDDLSQVLPHLFRVILYGSGVLFSVTVTVDDPTIRDLFVLNPFYSLIELARWSVMGMAVGPWVVVSGVAWSVISLGAGFWFFRRAEHHLVT